MRVEKKEILEKISLILKDKKLTVASAESCSGGLIAHTLTNISGSSEYFDRGIVSYSNKAKVELLDIPKENIEKYGAVSEQVANAMAEEIRKKAGVDIGISTTGIAGPTGGTKEKPVGLVYIGLSTKDKTNVEKHQFLGTRLKNKTKTCNAALEMLYNYLKTV